MRRVFKLSLLTFMVTLSFFTGSIVFVLGAEFTKSETSDCVVLLHGEILAGDFGKFLPVAQKLFPGSNGESTSPNTICLDSPGGSLAEGVKFAQYFYNEGVGTVIGDGQSCYSACAIMFMMGIAKGDEVNFINRKLHISGTLGFHRPFISVDTDELVSAKELNIVYNAAIDAAMRLLIIANNKTPWSNSQMMRPDLIQTMLQHIGDDVFLIDTVDKAGRWEIEIIGFDPPELLTEEQAFYACENSFQWQYGLTSGDKTYNNVKKRLEGSNWNWVKPIENANGYLAYHVTGLDSGYVAASCVISYKSRSTNLLNRMNHL